MRRARQTARGRSPRMAHHPPSQPLSSSLGCWLTPQRPSSDGLFFSAFVFVFPWWPMHIWVDADACPAVIKDILYRAAERTKIPMTLVANKLLRAPRSPYIRALQVRHGIDVADSHIVRELAPGDLVVTADIPLAADVIAKGGHALNPRGEFYSPENIQERLALRNYLDELRGTGERTGGPASLDHTERQRLAEQLDRFLARSRKAAPP